MTAKTEKGLREMFQSLGFWLLVAYVVLGAVVVVEFYENGRTTRALIRTSNLEQENRLKIEAGAQAGYIACIAGIPLTKKINNFAGALYDEHQTFVRNSKAIIRVTTKDDPQFKIKKANLKRLVKDGPAISAVHFQVQTKKTCKLAEKEALAQVKPVKVPKGRTNG